MLVFTVSVCCKFLMLVFTVSVCCKFLMLVFTVSVCCKFLILVFTVSVGLIQRTRWSSDSRKGLFPRTYRLSKYILYSLFVDRWRRQHAFSTPACFYSILTYMWAVSVVMMTLLLCVDIYVGCISGHHDTIALRWHTCGLYQWSSWHYCSALTYMLCKSGLVMTRLLCVDGYICCIRGCDDTIALLANMSAISGALMTLLLCVDNYVCCIRGCDDTISVLC